MKLRIIAIACCAVAGLLSGCAEAPDESPTLGSKAEGPGPMPNTASQQGPIGIYLQTSSSGQYLSATGGGGGAITATAAWTRGWEQFEIYDVTSTQLTDGDVVYLAASNGQFLSA